LPIEWNGANIGEGLKVAPLGADTAAVRTELDKTEKIERKRA
jgi:formyl-CoA transferase